jgi:hypothetical protein
MQISRVALLIGITKKTKDFPIPSLAFAGDFFTKMLLFTNEYCALTFIVIPLHDSRTCSSSVDGHQDCKGVNS